VFVQATSKVFLGSILLINVLGKASFEEALSAEGANHTFFNQTAVCLGLE
jgi:hypothetical protein